MVEGKITSYSRGSGEGGAATYVTAVDKAVIGSGASKKLQLGLTTPLHGEGLKAERVTVDLGMIVPRDVVIPFRVIVSLDGVTITREFKPQSTVEIEDGVYGKVVYDATALLASKIVERDLHKLSIIYTAARPVIFEDSGVGVVYGGVEGGWYSYNFLSGALTIEPGDIVEVVVDLPESRLQTKDIVVKMHVPSRHSNIRVEVGGSSFDAGGVVGPTVIEAPVRIRGNRVRVYFYYERPAERFYPRKAVLSAIAVTENIVPRALVEIAEARVEGGPGSYRVELRIANRGEARASNVVVMAFSEGATLSKVEAGSLDPGDEVAVPMDVRLSREGGASEVLVRVFWRSYGKPYHVDKVLRLP